MVKVVFGTKDGKCVQKEFSDEDSAALMGKKVGETIKGEILNLTGYEFQITGGSDNAGFPMRKDVDKAGLGKILAVTGVGLNNKKKYRDVKKKGLRKMKGMRTRKTVAGNTIWERTAQVNLKVLKEGKQPLVEAPAEETDTKEEPTKEVAPAEKSKPKVEENKEESSKKTSKEE